MKSIKIIIICSVTIGLFFILWLGSFTAFEYSPESPLKLNNSKTTPIRSESPPHALKIMTWNIGYCGLDKRADSAMEGGAMGTPDSRGEVLINLDGIKRGLLNYPADIYYIQEVDRPSWRSYFINQEDEIRDCLKVFNCWHAINFRVLFVPSPWYDPIGFVNAGLMTLSKWDSVSSERHQLPGEFSWPVRIFHLKRCAILTRIKSPLEGKDWCLINIHLSAYDPGGTLRKKQLSYLRELIVRLYKEGHFVVLGGDWNSFFPGLDKKMYGSYTIPESSLYYVSNIEKNWTPDNWQWAYDKEVPTSRTLEGPYKKGENFLSLIDGFLLSPNIELLNVKGIDLDFAHTDHNPVMISIKLKE